MRKNPLVWEPWAFYLGGISVGQHTLVGVCVKIDALLSLQPPRILRSILRVGHCVLMLPSTLTYWVAVRLRQPTMRTISMKKTCPSPLTNHFDSRPYPPVRIVSIPQYQPQSIHLQMLHSDRNLAVHRKSLLYPWRVSLQS